MAGSGDGTGLHQPHNNVFFNGTLPGPTCDVAHQFAAIPIQEQKEQAAQLLEFLMNETKQLLALNGDQVPRVALLALPSSSKVKVVYGLGVGASGITNTTPIDGKVLALTGNGNNTLGPPSTVVLPTSTTTPANVKSLSEDLFLEKLTSAGNGYRWPLAQVRAASDTNPLVQLAPIPAFLVYDGFDNNLDAAEVYERVLSLDNHDTPMMLHLKQFLRATVVNHNQDDNTPALQPDVLMQTIPNEARIWAVNQCQKYFPTLLQQQPATPQRDPTTNAPGGGITPEVRELLTHLLPAQAQLFQANKTTEEKKDDVGTLGMSEQELEVTTLQCTGRAGAPQESLPAWFASIAAKGMGESFKLQIIRKHLIANEFYEDAEVPLTTTLLKMIVKRQWAGTGNHRRPTIASAFEGLSIFAMIDIEDDEVAQLNILEEAIDSAKVTTVEDLLKTKSKAGKVRVPDNIEEFMRVLKRFANLIYALFSKDCPLFLALKAVIDALRAYSPTARQALSLQTKAAILWIILLQSRHFAMGEVDVLSEFQAMQRKLAEKERHITHAELPAALIAKPKQQDQPKADSTSKHAAPPTKPTQESKRQKTADPNPNVWHPKLKSSLEKAMMAANHPTFTAIMKYCDVDTTTQCVGSSSVCTPNYYFGKCMLGNNCPRRHTTPSDADVEVILKQVKKFIDNPTGIHNAGK